MATTTLKPSYIASSALTTTGLQSLAYSSAGTAGWQSAVQDNTSDLGDDVIVTFVIKMNTSVAPTVSTIVEILFYEILDDTPTYPDGATGTEGAITFTSNNTKYAGAYKATSFPVDAATSRLYQVTTRLSVMFGGAVPKKWGVCVVNWTGQAFAASGNVVTKTVVQYTNS
jgi:hypothetical protein